MVGEDSVVAVAVGENATGREEGLTEKHDVKVRVELGGEGGENGLLDVRVAQKTPVEAVHDDEQDTMITTRGRRNQSAVAVSEQETLSLPQGSMVVVEDGQQFARSARRATVHILLGRGI